MTLGQLIRQTREAKGWTQQELEKRTGISQTHISQLERDRITTPTPPVLHPIADALEISDVECMRAIGLVRTPTDDTPALPPELQAIYNDVQKLPRGRRERRLQALSQMYRAFQIGA